MYIIEKLIKLYNKYKRKKSIYNIPIETNRIDIQPDIVTCRHTFMPVDSTGNILACTKCGYLITRKKLEERRKKLNKCSNSAKSRIKKVRN